MSLKEDKKVYNVILHKAIKEKVDEIARKEERSSSNLINFVLKKFIEEYNKKE